MTSRRLLATTLCLFAGCMVDDAEPTLDTVTSEVITNPSDAVTPCPRFNGCGENSPVMGGLDFHELSVNPADRNDSGLRVARFRRGNQLYIPQIEAGSRIVAISATDPSIKLSGSALAGGYFEILDEQQRLYQLHIDNVTAVDVSPVKFWIGPDQRIETYELTYTPPSGSAEPQPGHRPLCAVPPDEPPDVLERLWPRRLEALVFSGDRYDARSLTVTSISAADTANWFNIACSGSALAKVHLMRHTTVGGRTRSLTYTTNRAERQALLKMYTGDFCGDGRRWTSPGTPLHWTNRAAWTVGTASAILGNEAQESFWTADGATCLGQHRLGTSYRDQILQQCSNVTPACWSPVDAEWPTAVQLRSAVP